jgi:GntR family transcriptional regulator
MTSRVSGPQRGDGLEDFGSVNRFSPIPLHHQVAQLLADRIDDGSLSPDEPLPPEHHLAAHYGTSLAPVRQALLQLTRADLLYRVPGSGTFVHPPPVVEEVSHLTSFSEAMRKKGFTVDVTMLDAESLPPPKHVAESLAPDESRVLLLRRLAIVSGEPFAILTSYLPIERFPELVGAGLQRGSLYHTLATRYGVVPTQAETVIGVVRSTMEQSAHLGVAVGTALLSARGTMFDQADRPCESFDLRYRADRVQLRIDSRRLEPQT